MNEGSSTSKAYAYDLIIYFYVLIFYVGINVKGDQTHFSESTKEFLNEIYGHNDNEVKIWP